MPDLNQVDVDLSTENTRSANEREVAQITIRDNRGTILRAEERSNDIFTAVDAVIDKLYRQISRYRGKRQNKWRNSPDTASILEPLPIEEELEALEEEEGAERIVRYKRFTMRPMAAEEAIEQMELLGHDFFVFYNMDDDAVNVLYRRHDGDYGLLQPELI
jgi:putative sigma-54 modulation protein